MDKTEAINAAAPYTGIHREGLSNIWDLCRERPLPPGSVVECGVVNGGSAALIWAACGGERDLWMFDSWEGLPPPTSEDGGRAGSKYDFHVATQGAWCKGDIEKAAHAAHAVGCKRANLVKGWFDETLRHHAQEVSPIACLHIDADWYNSIMECLIQFWPEVAPGGLVIFNDWGYWPGCERAAKEYFRDCAIDASALVVSKVCGAWIWKERQCA